MKCTVCNHPQRCAIDRALLAGGVTFEALKKKYGPSMSALWRHKKHLLEKMRQAEKRFLDNLRQGCLLKLNSHLERTERTAQAAETEGDSRVVLQAGRDATRILTYINKMDIQLDSDTVYRLLTSPQWARQGGLLPTDPQFLAAANQFLADDLFIPCPEPPPDEDDDDEMMIGMKLTTQRKLQPPRSKLETWHSRLILRPQICSCKPSPCFPP